MPSMMMDHANDPKQALMSSVGDISGMDLFHNNVIVAVYIRPEKTKSGIFLPDTHRDEDRWQSKIGVILKMGDSAFLPDGSQWNWGKKAPKVGDWVFFRPSDGFNITLRGEGCKDGVLCRRLKDTSIEGVVPNPDMVW